jgi:hypothetical protein
MSPRKSTRRSVRDSVDGVPRSHRDQRDMAIEAAAQLMLKYPNSVVAVKDLQSGKALAVDSKLDLRDPR